MSVLIDNYPPVETTGPHFRMKKGEIIAVFGAGEKRKAAFARQLAQSLGKNNVVQIDFSGIDSKLFNAELEQERLQRKTVSCPEQKRVFETLDACALLTKSVPELSADEKARLLLALRASLFPDTLIINRPSVIRRFNREINALRKVYKPAFILTDRDWNMALALTSDRVFEVGKKAFVEVQVEI